MNLTVILTTLFLTASSAWLVIHEGWEIGQAFGVVAIAASLVLTVLVSILFLLAGREDRPEIFQVIKSTFLEDLDQMLKYIRIRRR